MGVQQNKKKNPKNQRRQISVNNFPTQHPSQLIVNPQLAAYPGSIKKKSSKANMLEQVQISSPAHGSTHGRYLVNSQI